ncbi:HTH domain-containing protein [Candidatus Oleimmundimicrobium sp.]|uniref:HTH domain-containing protein n=1 Tax=Candidatus Oleimmundimicrobium sp. TaxID=3060597 RepID=UPI002725FC98|nr:HTH domain-containing protein [Candidatus Oleimmundimicrobium sp.]MDO8886221.1 HTH domain-containing protein [Candidatus Oleimmundimicrobium sp.]
MAELKWKEAIVKVFEDEKKALHYTDIAELIAERDYRKSLGATPLDTVSAVITTDINTNKEKSIFAKVDKGIYILRKFLDDRAQLVTEETEAEMVTTQKTTKERYKIINAFGIYWNRNLVYWKTTPDLLGIQQIGASEVNFKDQIGIYLLHDSRETIYIGQAIDQPLGQRLKNHTNDRLGGRWDRFSWFGFYPVNETGKLLNDIKLDKITVQHLGDILEAILIESIEPRQNRKQGNLFFGLEYLQQEAPEIKKRLKEQIIRELTDKL